LFVFSSNGTAYSTGTDDDLEYYVREAGDILGVTPLLDQSKRDGKHILEAIFKRV
jgi:intraflagellar transport protein 52